MTDQAGGILTTPAEEPSPAPSSFDVLEAMERAGFPRIFRRLDWVMPPRFKKYIPPLRTADRDMASRACF